MAQKEDVIRVIHVQAGKGASIVSVKNDLDDLRELVGGHLEATCPFSDIGIILVCNSEGMFLDLPVGWEFKDGNGNVIGAIYGNFFLCRIAGEHFASLTDEDTEKYLARFSNFK